MDIEMNVKMEGSELKEKQEGEKEQREVPFVWTLQELSGSMEAIEQHKVQEDQNETSVTNGKECMCDIFMLYYIAAYLNVI